AVALAVLEANLETELEILVLLLAAKEGVEARVFFRQADDGTVLDAPELHQAFKAFEVFAVEECFRGLVHVPRRTAGPRGKQAKQGQYKREGTHGGTPGTGNLRVRRKNTVGRLS